MLRPLWLPWFLKQGKAMPLVGTVETLKADLDAWIEDLEKWIVTGLPPREPLTHEEAQRRLRILAAARELMG